MTWRMRLWRTTLSSSLSQKFFSRQHPLTQPLKPTDYLPLDAVDCSALEEVRFANVVECEASAETFMPHDVETSLLGGGEDFSWGEESEKPETPAGEKPEDVPAGGKPDELPVTPPTPENPVLSNTPVTDTPAQSETPATPVKPETPVGPPADLPVGKPEGAPCAHAHDKADEVSSDESEDIPSCDELVETQAATPATPAIPATPATPGETPATPAEPATPETQVGKRDELPAGKSGGVAHAYAHGKPEDVPHAHAHAHGKSDDTSLIFTIMDLDSNNSLDVIVTGSNGNDCEYTDINNLNGGAASNVEIVIDSSITASVTWTITPGGAGKLAVDGYDTINFTNIDTLTGAVGGSGSDTLIGPSIGSVWEIDGANSGTVAGVSFSGIENLLGGHGNDKFDFSSDGSISGSIDGHGGSDHIRGGDKANQWHVSGSNSGKLNNGNFSDIEYLEGGNDIDEFVIADGASLAGGLDGQAGTDTLAGSDTENTWTMSGLNSGDLNGLVFSEIENLIGGAATDTLVGSDTDNIWIITGRMPAHSTGWYSAMSRTSPAETVPTTSNSSVARLAARSMAERARTPLTMRTRPQVSSPTSVWRQRPGLHNLPISLS